jgi:hypothetical protein
MRVEADMGLILRKDQPSLRRALAMVIATVMLCLPVVQAQQAPEASTGQAATQTADETAAKAPALSNEEMVKRIDAAVAFRTANLAGYEVKELYTIYRNGEKDPAAQVTVKTVYTRGEGKEYTPVSETGSSILRNVVIDHVLANEKEMAKAANRDAVAVTSANYEMQSVPGVTELEGRQCVVMLLKAKRKTPYLFNGKGWFDASDFTLVRLQGIPAQSVSFLAGETSGRREYGRINGLSMALKSEAHAHSFLLGDTVMTIEYSDYQLKLRE